MAGRGRRSEPARRLHRNDKFETGREAETLRASNCDELQGHLIARPMPAPELVAWIGRALDLVAA